MIGNISSICEIHALFSFRIKPYLGLQAKMTSELLRVSKHPLVADKISQLRDSTLRAADFRFLVDQLCSLLAYEVTLQLPLENVSLSCLSQLIQIVDYRSHWRKGPELKQRFLLFRSYVPVLEW